MHPPGILREEDKGLPGGIARAHHDHLLATAQLGLHRRRRVVDARSFEFAESGHGELSVFHAARDQHAPALEPNAVLQLHLSVATVEAQGLHRGRNGDLGTEPLGLHHRIVGELRRPRSPEGKPR